MDAAVQITEAERACPEEVGYWERLIRTTVEEMLAYVHQDADGLRLDQFQRGLWPKIALLFRLFVALFLAVRHQRLDLTSYRREGWHVECRFAKRTIKTFCGAVRYGRAYLRRGAQGWFPLDAVLGITADGFCWRIIDIATRLATRLSYHASKRILIAILGWSPSEEAIERLVLGLGLRAPAYVASTAPPQDDGEVLVIEVDGKAAPMATEAELEARRHKRRRCSGSDSCGCARHRGRQRRRGRGKKKRKKRGHNSKNGRSATLVAMYTLRRGEDGKLHGPVNKRLWGTFHSRRAALEWARREATRRGFPPDTDKVVQIVIDGERCLRNGLQELFPNAIFTLDLCHAQERLWRAGRAFYKDGSEELARWVEPLNALLLEGRVEELLKRLREAHASIPRRGANTKSKRETLEEQIRYLDDRREMMRYGKYRQADLVLATGVIEGACRCVVGERLDCSGMRWKREGAEAVLRLRCIELNGEWESFIHWVIEDSCGQLSNHQTVKIRCDKPPPLRDQTPI
jgi:hypothetical protein